MRTGFSLDIYASHTREIAFQKAVDDSYYLLRRFSTWIVEWSRDSLVMHAAIVYGKDVLVALKPSKFSTGAYGKDTLLIVLTTF
jgi:hypothetical protein